MFFIDGSLSLPSSMHSTYALWCDQILYYWINAILLESALPYIVRVTSTKQAWNAFSRCFAFLTPQIMTMI